MLASLADKSASGGAVASNQHPSDLGMPELAEELQANR